MKIPENAKLVFDWIIYQVYQWEQLMFDGSLRTFEEIARPSSVFAIPVINNKILVSYQKQPNKNEWYRSLLGGRKDKWETSLEWAQRELLEEAGLGWGNRTMRFDKKVPPMNWKLYYYIVKDCKYISEPKSSNGEKIKIFELEREVFLEMAASGTFFNEPLKDRIMTAKAKDNISALKKMFLE